MTIRVSKNRNWSTIYKTVMLNGYQHEITHSVIISNILQRYTRSTSETALNGVIKW